jgi:hypothetical protein
MRTTPPAWPKSRAQLQTRGWSEGTSETRRADDYLGLAAKEPATREGSWKLSQAGFLSIVSLLASLPLLRALLALRFLRFRPSPPPPEAVSASRGLMLYRPTRWPGG